MELSARGLPSASSIESLPAGTDPAGTIDFVPRVLVADDDPAHLHLIGGFARAAGCKVTTASSGEEALQRFEELRHEIVLMDVLMPGMGGIEAVRLIRAQCPRQWTRVLLVSGLQEEQAVLSGLDAGADDYVFKPLRAAVFQSKMRTLIRSVQLQRQMLQGEQRLRSVFMSAPLPYQALDAIGRIVEVNRAWESLLGRSREDVIGSHFIDLVDAASRASLDMLLEADRLDSRQAFPVVQVKNPLIGQTLHVEVQFSVERDAREEFVLCHCNLIDVSHRVTAERERDAVLRQLRISSSVFDSMRDGVMITDTASRIVEVNPAFCQITGYARQEVIGQDAALLHASPVSPNFDAELRPQPGSSRPWQGEVLLRRKDGSVESDMMTVSRVPDDGRAGNFRFVSIISRPDASRDEVFTALRGSGPPIESSPQAPSLPLRQLSDDFPEALQAGQFSVLFQPIVELSSGKICKAEALVRWNHPVHGPLRPADFIPVAERFGHIRSLDLWVLNKVLDLLPTLRVLREDFRLSTNFSPATLMDRQFDVAQVIDRVARSGVPGSALTIEVTEGVVLSSDEKVRQDLAALRQADIRIAVDDFGTGHSSISYLNSFQFDYLKIDQSFVNGALGGSHRQTLCEAMIRMGQSLGLQVIAEGIETKEQARHLAEQDCDFGQGYYFSHPVAVQALKSLLLEGSLPRRWGTAQAEGGPSH